jgi:hypothetical protein
MMVHCNFISGSRRQVSFCLQAQNGTLGGMNLGVGRTAWSAAWPQAFGTSILAVISGRSVAAEAQWLLAVQLGSYNQRPLADYHVAR